VTDRRCASDAGHQPERQPRRTTIEAPAGQQTLPVGLEPGDPVRVEGLRGEFHFASWREESGGLVANIISGTAGHHMFRSVTADRLKPCRRGQHKPIPSTRSEL
jgi:hypothetical protein